MAKNAKKETWSKLKITVLRKLDWGTFEPIMNFAPQAPPLCPKKKREKIDT